MSSIKNTDLSAYTSHSFGLLQSVELPEANNQIELIETAQPQTLDVSDVAQRVNNIFYSAVNDVSFLLENYLSPDKHRDLCSPENEEEGMSVEQFFESNYAKILQDEKQWLWMGHHQLEGGQLQFSKLIGKGGYGEVYKGVFINEQTKEIASVAIKVNRIFEKYSKTRYLLDSLRIESEIHQNISSQDTSSSGVFTKFIASGFLTDRRFCIVQELCPISLCHLITRKNFFGFSFEKVFYFSHNLLSALKAMHEPQLGYVHTDLKPENILLTDFFDYKIKIIDFSMMQRVVEGQISKFKGSRNYSPPEIHFKLPYSFTLDIWSLGCILFELYTGKQLFKSKTDLDLILMMQELLGPIPKKFIEKSCFFKNDFEESSEKDFYILKEKKGDLDFENTKFRFESCFEQAKKNNVFSSTFFNETSFDEVESLFKDMLFSMLKWNPNERWSALDLLKHPFMVTMEQLLGRKNKSLSAFKPFPSRSSFIVKVNKTSNEAKDSLLKGMAKLEIIPEEKPEDLLHA